ncbi:MAG: phosphoenolpyruvate synthase [Candidatus Kerfeldbacteria bacterium]|nr:phosphoenolpyruvate synthase [Candidatus Kerfeldbacteria bacterium]
MSLRRDIRWFRKLTMRDVPIAGGKNASLGEMIRQLSPKGVRVPDGFAVTADAYFYFVKSSGIDRKIRAILRGLDTRSSENLATRGHSVRQLILETPLPQDLADHIVASYHELERMYRMPNVDVAVRSSATAEDLPDASFAGQQETYLNIRGEEALLSACHRCFASLFTDRAISYRVDKKFNHFKVGLSIGVQKMVRSDQACSGVMFTLDTESGFRDVVLINGSWGLGENIVQGAVNPDEFYVHKPTLMQGFRPIMKRRGAKKIKMVYTRDVHHPTKNIPTTPREQHSYVLSDAEIVQLAKWGVLIEKHYKKPMDMEWAKDGVTGKLYIVQARPETVQSQKSQTSYQEYRLQRRSECLVSGMAVGSKIGTGPVRKIEDPSQIRKFRPGEVLVTDMTDPDWEPIMKIASAIVTNRGGRTCHAAIVSRELGIPCVVGTENATAVLRDKMPVTVSCAEGEVGNVYAGKLPFTLRTVNLKNVRPPKKTKIMMNIGDPGIAFTSAALPNAGVGLAREEFIVTSSIKIHPLALARFSELKDSKARKEIQAMTGGYADKKEYYIEKLASGIGTIAAAFYPKDVILRLSDFKTNEYAGLIGGAQFEPTESNPMIGWRGASRYYDPNFATAFAMECEAIKRVRNVMGFTNVKVMIPMCRTIEEAHKVLKLLSKHGLRRGAKGLEIYVMCEVPANVILAEQFAALFDGFSIGSNDLTQFTLAVDRDSELVSHVYSESNEAVKTLIRQVIRTAKQKHRKIGICGQAPSDDPKFAAFLVKEGIDSISLNPDTVIKTMLQLRKR